LHREVNESISDHELWLFRELAEKVGRRFYVPLLKRTNPVNIPLLRIAAMLLLVAGIAAMMKYVFFNDVNTVQLYRQYYTTYDADAILRSSQDGLLNPDQGIMDYSQGDYTEAMNRFDARIKKDSGDYLVWFFRGLTCMETHKMTEAIRSFRMVPLSWNSMYREHLHWYLALALLRNGNRNEAAGLFRHIDSEGGYYAEKARKITRKLDR
jgi:tetratricopeptide (TPR) repeat protein